MQSKRQIKITKTCISKVYKSRDLTNNPLQTANLTKEENLSNGKVTNFRMLFKILIEQSPSDKTRIKENLSKS